MRARIAVVLVMTAGLAGVTGLEPDEKVKLEQCPKPVRETILAKAGGGTIVEIERTTDHGRVLYEVDVRGPSGVFEFDVEEDGTFAGMERDSEEEEDEDEAFPPDAEPGDWDTPGPSRTPLANGAQFSSRITHPYFPLSTTRFTELRSGDERIIREVEGLTKNVGGVECLVLAEREFEDGELAEISYNYFAQDETGNVYYFGENVDDYENGKIVGHGGAWLVGRNAEEPCLFMPAELTPGFRFKRESSPPDAEEWDMIGDLDEHLAVPAATFDQVLVILETDEPGRWQERKYYARGIGLISENGELNLVRVGRAE